MKMSRSCAIVLLGILALARGEEGTTDNTDVEVLDAENSTSSLPPVVVYLLNLPPSDLGTPDNGTASPGNSSSPAEPRVLVITVEVPEGNGTEAEPPKPVKRMAEAALSRSRRFADSGKPLVRRKRTFGKKHGCGMICSMMKQHIPMGCSSCNQQPACTSCGHPQPQVKYVYVQQQQPQHPPPCQSSCGGGCGSPCGGGGGGGSYSHSSSSSSSQSSSGSWGKKK